jgi:hypothetical protein
MFFQKNKFSEGFTWFLPPKNIVFGKTLRKILTKSFFEKNTL